MFLTRPENGPRFLLVVGFSVDVFFNFLRSIKASFFRHFFLPFLDKIPNIPFLIRGRAIDKKDGRASRSSLFHDGGHCKAHNGMMAPIFATTQLTT